MRKDEEERWKRKKEEKRIEKEWRKIEEMKIRIEKETEIEWRW